MFGTRMIHIVYRSGPLLIHTVYRSGPLLIHTVYRSGPLPLRLLRDEEGGLTEALRPQEVCLGAGR